MVPTLNTQLPLIRSDIFLWLWTTFMRGAAGTVTVQSVEGWVMWEHFLSQPPVFCLQHVDLQLLDSVCSSANVSTANWDGEHYTLHCMCLRMSLLCITDFSEGFGPFEGLWGAWRSAVFICPRTAAARLERALFCDVSQRNEKPQGMFSALGYLSASGRIT